jgi:SAM-dependent methyltransferase
MTASTAGLLGDTTQRDYSRKLQRFNSFAQPEIRRALEELDLQPGMRVLDAGCGTGEALAWALERVRPEGLAVGFDLSAVHLCAARARVGRAAPILQADLLRPPILHGSFDMVWSMNTVHHVRNPAAAASALASLLRAGGRLALGQSALLPEMYFAWDSRLERATLEALRRYYEQRYGLAERELSGVRSLVGWLRRACLRNVRAHTLTIDRIAPLAPADEAFLLETIFRDTWGERLRPYLAADDYEELLRLCDPQSPEFALRRDDFHFLQTFTVAVGEAAGR